MAKQARAGEEPRRIGWIASNETVRGGSEATFHAQQWRVRVSDAAHKGMVAHAYGSTHDEARARGRLIEAAPEMATALDDLQAIAEIVADVVKRYCHESEQDALVTRARRARALLARIGGGA